MVPLVPTFLPMVTLAPMVPLAAVKRSVFSCYQCYHWLPMVPLEKFSMVPLGEFRTHALFVKTVRRTRGPNGKYNSQAGYLGNRFTTSFRLLTRAGTENSYTLTLILQSLVQKESMVSFF